MDKEYLYDWVFNFNPYTQKYQGVRKENYNDLFNDQSKVLKAKTLDELEKKISQTPGGVLV